VSGVKAYSATNYNSLHYLMTINLDFHIRTKLQFMLHTFLSAIAKILQYPVNKLQGKKLL